MKTINTILIVLALLSTNVANAQNATDIQYRRSSLYSVMINHTDQRFGKEIREAFLQMETPDKYNNHDLSVKILTLNKKLEDVNKDRENTAITAFINNNDIASRLVGKWFNRDQFTGQCDMELVKSRGLYNATEFDKALASKSARTEALLMDAGEDLIGNTYVLVNDIRYIDKEKGSKVLGSILRIAGSVASVATGVNFDDLADNLGDIAESFKGFKVKINTFLYKLEWDETTAADFYRNQYSSVPDKTKLENFENGRGKFKLKFVGKVESSGSTTSFMGIKEDQPIMMVLKACQRALDENIVNLQNEVEDFRTKVPLQSVEPITAYVGMKEGVNEKSLFEVLEIVEDKNGKRSYKRVGTIKPNPSLVWDNRFMAEEEGALNATLGYTTFKKESGGDFFPGMLIREIKK